MHKFHTSPPDPSMDVFRIASEASLPVPVLMKAKSPSHASTSGNTSSGFPKARVLSARVGSVLSCWYHKLRTRERKTKRNTKNTTPCVCYWSSTSEKSQSSNSQRKCHQRKLLANEISAISNMRQISFSFPKILEKSCKATLNSLSMVWAQLCPPFLTFPVVEWAITWQIPKII